MKWYDLTPDLTKEGQRKLKVGQVLLFEKIHLKIMRKYKGKVWAKENYLTSVEEAQKEGERRTKKIKKKKK